MLFEPLHKKEIFPEMSGIFSASKWTEVINDGITKADVAEINFLAFFNLVIKVSGKRIAAFDDEALFQDVDVTFDSLAVHLELSAKAFVGDLLTDSIGKQFDQMLKTAGAADIL